MRRANVDGSGIARQLSGIRPSRHPKVSYGDRQGALTFVNSIGSFLQNAPLAQRVCLRHVRLRISTLRKFAKFTLPLTSYLFIRRELLRPLRRKAVEERSDALPRFIGGTRHSVRPRGPPPRGAL